MTQESKQAYLDKMNAQLREWTAKVEVVKARLAKDTAQVRIDYHNQIEKWTMQESAFKQHLTDLHAIGNEGYESLKGTVQTAWTDLKNLTTAIEENKTDEKKH